MSNCNTEKKENIDDFKDTFQLKIDYSVKRDKETRCVSQLCARIFYFRNITQTTIYL